MSAPWNLPPVYGGSYPSVPGNKPDEVWLDPVALDRMRSWPAYGPAYGLGRPYTVMPKYQQQSPSPPSRYSEPSEPAVADKAAAQQEPAAFANHDASMPLPSPYKEGPKGVFGFGLYQILNMVWFILNAFFVNTSTFGWYGATNTDQSKKYTTFLTPKGTAFSIWGLIYILEGLFSVYQLLPSQRGTNNVLVNRIGFTWVAAQIAQIIWTFTFAQDEIWASWVFMALIYFFLGALCVRLDPGRTDTLVWATYGPECRIRTTPTDWFFYYFPFQLHFGWITAAFILNTNVCVLFEQDTLIAMIGTAIACLGIALASAFFWVAIRRDMVHSFVISWATFFISQHIVDPATPLPLGTMNDTDLVRGLALASAIVAVITLLLGLLSIAMAWTSFGLRWRAGRRAAGAALAPAV